MAQPPAALILLVFLLALVLAVEVGPLQGPLALVDTTACLRYWQPFNLPIFGLVRWLVADRLVERGRAIGIACDHRLEAGQQLLGVVGAPLVVLVIIFG